ncbi:MAG: ATP-binding protein [Clostridia bacterium]|nr:ATP-binding protein [Clostridia bacterium]
MIKLITGAKGTGKTKIIIDMANDNVETAKGDIVFITDTDKYKFSLRYQIRLINVELLKKDGVTSEDALIGFIKGVLAGNHDIETLYIDGAHRILNKPVKEMEDFFNDIYDTAMTTDTKFVLTVSENEENFPEFLKKYKANV